MTDTQWDDETVDRIAEAIHNEGGCCEWGWAGCGDKQHARTAAVAALHVWFHQQPPRGHCMTAPRIDTVRSDIRQAIELLHFLGDQLDDLHVLAYNRHRALERVKVRGGSVDYALDTHGDKRARDLYAQVAKDVLSAVDKLTGSIKGVRGYLTSGAGTIRRDATADCTHDEVIAALDAQRRRRHRGEYQPAPLVDQPQVWSQTEWRTECEALRSAVRKVTGDFVADHQTCQATEVDHRGQRPKLPRRPRLKLLTPREREAWHRANQSVSDQNDEKAS